MTKLDIWNLALSHLQVGVRLTGLDDESTEALALGIHYEPAKLDALREINWSFLQSDLPISAVRNDDTGFYYAIPENTVRVLAILDEGNFPITWLATGDKGEQLLKTTMPAKTIRVLYSPEEYVLDDAIGNLIALEVAKRAISEIETTEKDLDTKIQGRYREQLGRLIRNNQDQEDLTSGVAQTYEQARVMGRGAGDGFY